MTAALDFSTKPVLLGPKVELRPLGLEHVDVMFGAMNDPESRRLTGTHREFTREDIERWCLSRAEQVDRLDYAIHTRPGGEYVGDLALNGLDPDNRSCGFRIALLDSAVGRGYGTEATQLAVDHAFAVGVHRIELEVYAFNPRARHVYEKVGFQLEGTKRQALWWDGEWVDADLMAILAEPR